MEEARCTKISKKTFISKNKLQKTCKSCCLVKQKKYKFRIREEASVFTPFLHHFYTIFTPFLHVRRASVSVSVFYNTFFGRTTKNLSSLRVCVSLSNFYSLQGKSSRLCRFLISYSVKRKREISEISMASRRRRQRQQMIENRQDGSASKRTLIFLALAAA